MLACGSESRRVDARKVKSAHDEATFLRFVPMKITRILAYRVELPLVETSYKWSGGKSVTVFDSTIVGVETDAGTVGHGEVVRSDLSIFQPMPKACGLDCVNWDRT